MDDQKVRRLIQDLVSVATITKSQLLRDAADTLAGLLGENLGLKDQLWSAERLSHANDPWEAEDA